MSQQPWWRRSAAHPYFAVALILAGLAVLAAVGLAGPVGWTGAVTLAILAAGMVWCAWMAATAPDKYGRRDDEDQQQ